MSRALGSTELKRLHRDWRRRAPGRLALLLDSVATPFNVGSIVRTAAAMRVDDIWITGQTALETHASTQKTALGSQRFVTFHHEAEPAAAVAAARAAGYRVVGVELADGALPLHEADLTGAVLRGADLSGADLKRAMLVGADLGRAILHGAQTRQIDLTDANLTGVRGLIVDDQAA